MTYESLWKAVLGEIELSISKAQFNTWFKNTSIASIDNGVVVISVPNGFAKEWLENKYHLILLRSLNKHDETIREVSCQVLSAHNTSATTNITKEVGGVFPQHFSPVSQTVIPTHFPEPASSPSRYPLTMPSNSSPMIVPGNTLSRVETNLNPRYNFETFIVGVNNELAKAACQAVANNPGIVYNPLFIYGPVGLGKTHLLQSIGNHVLRSEPQKRVLYISTERFTNELINAIKNKEMDRFKLHYQQIDLLIIDDVQFLSGREKTQHEFFNIFNTLYQLNKQIVISSDRPPKGIATLEDRLRSRFEGGMIADISKPDFETRMAILTSKSSQRNFYLSEEVAHYITENITDNVRELEGALNRIIAISEFQQERVISLETAKRILSELMESGKKKGVTIHDVIQTVCDHFGVMPDDLKRKGRKKEIAHPRQVAMFLLRTELQTPYTSIGRQIGGRDHTTALHAFEKITKDLELDERTREELDIIRQKIYASP